MGVTVQDADNGDTEPSIETLIAAAEQVEVVRPDGDGIEEVVGDKAITAINRSSTSRQWASAATSPNLIVDGGTGRRTRPHATLSTARC